MTTPRSRRGRAGDRRVASVLAVARSHQITTGIGPRRADELAARLPKQAWQRLSAGKGAKGERFYDWALIDTVDAAADREATGCHWLLIRRNRRTGELAYYRAYSPQPARLAALVRVAGTRWRIEESFQSGRELTAATSIVAQATHTLRWSAWRRRHQARSRTSHYQRQAAAIT